jgi:DNA modification methylase
VGNAPILILFYQEYIIMEYRENTIVHGNCVEVFATMKPFADLVFADPPFNIGYEYDKYHDKLPREAYIEWTEDWMRACMGILKPHGSFFIAIGDDYAANVKVIADRLGLNMRNWIIWHYTFGQQTKAKFARSHTHIFYFTKDEKSFTFNDYAVRVPSDRQLIYNDKRANSDGKLPDDTWNEFSRVCGTFREREGWHPCQMPEILLAKIIASASLPGDVVADPFMGSGTTAAAAIKLGRKYFGTDISENYVENINTRLQKISEQVQTPTGCPLNYTELFELKRFCIEIKHTPSELLEKRPLIDLTVKMFSARMNRGTPFKAADIIAALRLMQNERVCGEVTPRGNKNKPATGKIKLQTTALFPE